MDAPIMQDVEFIVNNLLVYFPVIRSIHIMKNWQAQRENSQHITEFETFVFREERKVIF